MWKFLLLIFLFSFQEQYPYKSGKPTSKGIDFYIKTEQLNIVKEYESFVKDTIYNFEISTDNLSEYTDADSLELGRTYYPDDIIVTNEPKFYDYVNPKKRGLRETDKFCKSVLLHELTHVYCTQVVLEMRNSNNPPSIEYSNFRVIPSVESNFGCEFIEEGICEYVPEKMGESIPYKNNYKLRTIEEERNPVNRFDVEYKYAMFFVKDFLDNSITLYGTIKPALIIIYHHKPPTYKEILNPEIYFNRILTKDLEDSK